MQVDIDTRQDIQRLITLAHQVSADIGKDVEELLIEGIENPLDREEAHRLFTKVVTFLRKEARKIGDGRAERTLAGKLDDLVEQIITTRDQITSEDRRDSGAVTFLKLQSRNRIPVGKVEPRPCFHGTEVPMNSGFVKTSDIKLWGENARLEIHLGQFEHLHGRRPSPEELFDIMLSRMEIPGVKDGDQFEIEQLANSIAQNGVRKPPIIDIDGTLLDGNRRVAACYHILTSKDFSIEEKKRVEYVFVWQLTEHATDAERDAIVVSLNFEDDCKKQWPEYVRARKVYEAWQHMLALGPRSPSPQELITMKRDLSIKFALGPDTAIVNRYLKMVDWINDFEAYHINDRKRDKFEVKHKADRYFQYFDEIAKGTRAGGVAYTIDQDDRYKRLVFDLLFEGKFSNWNKIRSLNYIYTSDEAMDLLSQAKKESDVDAAQDLVDRAVDIARARRAEMREVGANQRIEAFVKWLEELPVKAFRDSIKKENLKRLLRALKLVEKQANAILGSEV